MILRSPVARISVGIAMLTLSLLLVADAMFGLSTEGIRPQLTARKHLAETLAVQYSELAGRRDFDAMRIAMDLMVRRNPEILSTAVRQADGMLVTEAGDHRLHWRGAPPVESSQTHARVPIFDGDTRWGTLEVRFTSIGQGSVSGLLDTPWFRMLLFVTLAGTLVYFLFMRRTLRHLDPSAVVPARVRSAFDVLAEGVVFLDEEARIVLSNSAFCALVGSSAKELMGVRLGKLGWSLSRRVDGAEECAPWDACLDGASSRTGMTMVRAGGNDGRREYIVNAAPVLDDRRRARGVIVTFDDVTELERKKNELESLVAELQKSRDEIQRQNEKLELMATRDGLTNCLNRRAFVEVLEREISRASRDSNPLSCIMLDIDHFKSVNDTFGHAVGDDAIRFVAGVVSEGTRGYDIVCRYGGEEFCVLLPGAALDVAAQVSERIRKSVMEQSLVNLPQLQGRGLTISLGIALFDGSMGQPMELVNRADEALYSSKTSGRNRTSICDPKHSATQAVA